MACGNLVLPDHVILPPTGGFPRNLVVLAYPLI